MVINSSDIVLIVIILTVPISFGIILFFHYLEAKEHYKYIEKMSSSKVEEEDTIKEEKSK